MLELSLCELQRKIMEFQHARILYAEDDADTCELVTVLLAGENCQVIATESHDEALRLARSEHFDLYLIDNWTPGISGVGLCGQLREFDSHTPILFYSGAAYEADKKRALACSSRGYLVKPTDGDELAAEVLRLISDSRNRNHIRPKRVHGIPLSRQITTAYLGN